METSGKAVSFGGSGKTTVQMQTLATYLDAGWDFVFETFNGTADSWTIVSGQYPHLAFQTDTIPPDTAIVPNVVSMTQANAESAITTAKLTVWTTPVYSDTVAAGTVVNQNPAADTVLLTQMEVNIEISVGPRIDPGSGTEADPYKIVTISDWQTFMATSADWDKYFILMDDLDFRHITLTPVGNSDMPFTGSFDGNGRIIRNAAINTPASSYVGLFGFIDTSGRISNLGLESAL